MEEKDSASKPEKSRPIEETTQMQESDAKSTPQTAVEKSQMQNVVAKALPNGSDSSKKKKKEGKEEKTMSQAPPQEKKTMSEKSKEPVSRNDNMKTCLLPVVETLPTPVLPTPRRTKSSKKKIMATSCETQAEEISLRRKKTSKKKFVGTSCETQAEETSLRRKRTRKKDALEKTAIASAEVPDNEELKEKGRTLITEMRSRRSKTISPKKRKSKKYENGTIFSVEVEKPEPVPEKPKEEKSTRQSLSIRERLKRGIKSALSAFSRAAFERSFQSAKARMGYTMPQGKNLLPYQDTYLGGATEEEEDEGEEDEDVEAFTDTSHRPDLILVTTNNTNNGRIFNEKGRPFWKDKKFRSEIPKLERKPLSSVLFLLADKKLVLKESVDPPAYMGPQDQDLDDLMRRDKKHFNEELVLSNTVRSIIATLDGLEEFSKNKPQTIKNLDVVEPKTAVSYTRHFPQNHETVPFVYSGLGVCRSAKSKKKGRRSRSSSSSGSSSNSNSSSSSSTSDLDLSSRRARRKRKSRSSKTEVGSSKEKDKSQRSLRKKKKKKNN